MNLTLRSRRKIVLGLTLLGFPVKYICAELNVGYSTVGRDRMALMREHGARNIRQLLINTWHL